MKLKLSRLQLRLMATSAITCGIIMAPLMAQAQESTEVVITAQKRTERLKDAAVAASVVNTESLANANATDISDLNKVVPSVQLKGSFNGRVPMAMRGVSTSANEAAVGLTSGVAVLIDGVPTSSDSMAANQIADVERVEVLKGPQSTLGGRAASAGVINFVTKKPSALYKGNLSLLGTDDGQRRAEGFMSLPINDKFMASISAYGDHTEYAMVNLANGEHTTTDAAGARAKLLFKPTDNLDVMLTSRLAKMDSSGDNFVYAYLTPGATLFGISAPFMGQSVNLAGYTPSFENVEYNSVSGAASKIRDNDLALNVDYQLGDYTVSGVFASQHETQYNRQDVPIVATYFFDVLTGGFAPHYANYQEINLDITTDSSELKIVSPNTGHFTYVAGVFASTTTVDAVQNRDWVANPYIANIGSVTKTLGVYGRGTWAFAESWKLLIGARYNKDRVSYYIDQTANNSEGAYYSSGSSEKSNVVGDLTLQKNFANGTMVYGTISKGYKPHAYNTAAQLKSNATLAPVDSEDVSHIEFGLKGSYFNRKVNLSSALFSTDYKNYQIQVFDTGTTWPAPLKLDNAGEAKTQGLEVDATWRATDSLNVNFSAAYIDAKFVTYTGAPCYNAQTLVVAPAVAADGQCYEDATGFQSQDLSGKPMPDAPKLKYTIGLEKVLSFEFHDLILDGTYIYRSKANMQANQNPKTVQDAFGLLNLSATLAPKDSNYSVTLFVNNATDQFYVTNLEDFFSGIWGTGSNAVISQPARDSSRYVGVRLNASF